MERHFKKKSSLEDVSLVFIAQIIFYSNQQKVNFAVISIWKSIMVYLRMQS